MPIEWKSVFICFLATVLDYPEREKAFLQSKEVSHAERSSPRDGSHRCAPWNRDLLARQIQRRPGASRPWTVPALQATPNDGRSSRSERDLAGARHGQLGSSGSRSAV